MFLPSQGVTPKRVSSGKPTPPDHPPFPFRDATDKQNNAFVSSALEKILSRLQCFIVAFQSKLPVDICYHNDAFYSTQHLR